MKAGGFAGNALQRHGIEGAAVAPAGQSLSLSSPPPAPGATSFFYSALIPARLITGPHLARSARM